MELALKPVGADRSEGLGECTTGDRLDLTETRRRGQLGGDLDRVGLAPSGRIRCAAAVELGPCHHTRPARDGAPIHGGRTETNAYLARFESLAPLAQAA